MFNGVDVTFNVRNVKGVTFSGGTSTGKVVNDWCDIRAAVPEAFTSNPYCHVESPIQTSFNGLASYTIPKIDVLLSTVYRDRVILNGTPNNASTDQLGGSLPATFTFTATDATGQAIASQIGRNLTGGPFNVNVVTPGTFYPGRNRQLDLSFKKIFRLEWPTGDRRSGHLQRDEREHGALLQHRILSGCSDPGVPYAGRLHEPARIPARRRIQLVVASVDLRATYGASAPSRHRSPVPQHAVPHGTVTSPALDPHP